MTYVPLHTHTSYSLLDGATRTQELIDFCKQNEQPAASITNHGSMWGMVEFLQSSTSEFLAIAGCECYVECDANDIGSDSTQNRRSTTTHLILLAQNSQGYHNLCKLLTRANLENFYYKPLCTFDLLSQHHEGLIVLSGCLGSELSRAIVNGGKPESIISRYKELLGDRYFLEIQSHGIPDEDYVRDELARYSKQFDVPLVATQDSHYTNPEDAETHDTMLAMQVSKPKNDPDRFRFSGSGYHLATEAEMLSKFSMYPDAVSNSGYIASMVESYTLHRDDLIPKFPMLPEGLTAIEYLRELTIYGLKQRYGKPTNEAWKRAQHELEVIEQTGFGDYFLIVWDLMRQARCDGVRTGAGRGSAAGSIVSYALQITNVDPLAFGLVFERFLNVERVKMPDVDLDFADTGRDKVIQYAMRAYGEDKVAQIATVGTLAARSAVKGVAKALGVAYMDADRLAKEIPYDQFGGDLKKAIAEPGYISAAYKRGGWERQVLDEAGKLEGLAHHSGTHAAGVIVSPVPLQDVIPLQRPSGNDVTEIVAHYEMDELEKIGLLKIDFLGLSTLTLVQNTIDLIKQRQGIEIDIDAIPLDDGATYQLLQRADTHGVFQLETYGARKVLSKIRPESIEEICAVNAINRPGPLQGGVLELYSDRKFGRAPIEYLLPELEPILAETYGTIVYQEQIIKIAAVVCGYSLGEADEIRDAVGKKKRDKMELLRQEFIQRAIYREEGGLGISQSQATELFDLIEYFAAYGFNKSHSVCYSILGYQTAYLRCHYPLEFTCALLNMRGDDKDKLPLVLRDARIHNITVLGPDIHKSKDIFTLEGDVIRYGLRYVKDFGVTAYAALDGERQKRPFKSWEELLMRCNLGKLNSKALRALILQGGLDDLGDAGRLVGRLELDCGAAKRAKVDIHREKIGQKPVKHKDPRMAQRVAEMRAAVTISSQNIKPEAVQAGV